MAAYPGLVHIGRRRASVAWRHASSATARKPDTRNQKQDESAERHERSESPDPVEAQ
jgi:hypothetical protein